MRNFNFRHPLPGIVGIFLAGMVFWGGFNWSLELTNTESFCISCHAMRAYVFEEYKNTIHYNNRTGVRATCPDCHVPREWIYKVARKIRATNELLHWIGGSIATPEAFEAKRGELAQQVWRSMKATNSRECRNCHDIGFMTRQVQTGPASLMHGLAVEWGKTCIDCHKGIAHTLPRSHDANILMDELHELMAAQKVECRQCHADMAAPPAGEDW